MLALKEKKNEISDLGMDSDEPCESPKWGGDKTDHDSPVAKQNLLELISFGE